MESSQIFASFPGNDGQLPLSVLCDELLREQKASWPLLRQGHQAQENAQIRDIPCPGFTLRVQWNPQRIVSSAARIDPVAIRMRPCFLCRNNRPEAQRAILYRDEYFVLCNPAPIFAQHYTIAHVCHRPQSIKPALTAFLKLIRDFSPRFTVLYNGAQSGASAPDHLHFQAAPAGAMPVERDMDDEAKRQLLRRVNGVDVYRAVGLGRAMLLLEGMAEDRIASALLQVIAAMQTAFQTTDEPMMNLLGGYRENRWRIMVFPRGRHRPAVYDRPGDARILVSPGAVDMGGLFITPVEKDFRMMDAGLVQNIFQDVSVDEETMARIVAAL